MKAPARGLCLALALAALAAPALTGCGGDEPSVVSALAHSPVFAGAVRDLKREDDETDVREAREAEPQTREERVEARDAAEQAALEAAPPEEGEGG